MPASAGAEERHEAEAWFAREAYILSTLNHPLVPEFYSSFPEGGTSYIVQEYADGENLNDVVRARGPLPEDSCWSGQYRSADSSATCTGWTSRCCSAI